MTQLKIISRNDQPIVEMLNGRVLTDDELTSLNQMNSQYFHVIIGGKHRIMTKKSCPINGHKLVFEAIKDFSHNFDHLPPLAGANQGRAWSKWKDKNFYSDGLGFYPDASKVPPNCYNTYQGFNCTATQGDASLIVNHVKQVLCAGDEKSGKYFMQWLAHIFQCPEDKPTVAILIKSVEGTGKGTLFKLLQKMLGVHSAQINGHYQMTGRFNAVIAGKLLVFGDEVDLTSKAVFDKAKGIISETSVSMEYKGLDPEPVPNLARFIFTGNHDKMIAAGTRERRFLVLEPSATYVEDKNYWNELHQFIETKGAGVFLHHLMQINLDDFNPYNAPVTQGLIEEKLSSLKPSLSYLYGELCQELPFGGQKRITSMDLNNRFCDWSLLNLSEKIKLQSAGSQIGKAMGDLDIKVQGRSGRGQGKYYEIPNIEELLECFANYLGHHKDDLF